MPWRQGTQFDLCNVNELTLKLGADREEHQTVTVPILRLAMDGYSGHLSVTKWFTGEFKTFYRIVN
jgi:hypothetical protein